MLKIINNLSPFFEDSYRRINVREYAKLIKVSPPTASTILNQYLKEGILKKEEFRNYLFFYANTENKLYLDLSKIYWKDKLKDFLNFLDHELLNPTIILFGSLSKGEVKPDSDIDIAIFARKKKIDFSKIEKKLGRSFQILWFESWKSIKNNELAKNIINGVVLRGKINL